MGIGEPDMVAIACFIGPNRCRAADDLRDAQHAEIAPVEAVGCSRVHHEQLAIAQHLAARPYGQRATQSVARARHADISAIDGDAMRESADALAAHSGDALQKRYAGREVMPFSQQTPQFRRRFDGDAFADVQACLAADRVKPSRHRGSRVPHGIARDRNDQRRECGGQDGASQDEAAPGHGNSALRWSQAR